MNEKAIRVILADGRRLFRDGLCAILSKHTSFHVVGQADDARSTVRLFMGVEADVLVLIAGTQVRDLPHVVREIYHGTNGKLAILIVFSYNPDGALIGELLRSGALGCLARETTSEELIEGIIQILDRRVYLSPQLSAALVNHIPTMGRSSGKRLAPREREILRHLAGGQTTKQIASALHIAPKTVDTHRRRIMRKIDKRTLADLTKYAIREGLVSIEPE